MKVELLYFEGCPNYVVLRDRLGELLASEGADEQIDLQLVETDETAAVQRFLGSPSVRIDGDDVDPNAAQRQDFGLKCRLYLTGDGYTPSPPDEWIVEAIRRARRGPSDRSSTATASP